MHIKNIITYINSNKEEKGIFSTIKDEAQFHAKVHCKISMPFGKYLKQYLDDKKETELVKLGMGNHLIDFIKEAIQDRSLQKFIDHFSGHTSYSHAIKLTPYKFGAAEFMHHFIKYIDHQYHENDLSNTFKVHDLDIVFSNNSDSTYTMPFTINNIFGPRPSNTKIFTPMPRSYPHTADPSIDKLDLDPSKLANLYVDQLLPKLKVVNSKKYHQNKVGIPSKKLRQLIIQILSERISKLQEYTDTILDETDQDINVHHFYREFQKLICQEIMSKKGYDEHISTSIANYTGIDSLSNDLEYIEIFNSPVIFLYQKEGNRGLAKIMFGNTTSQSFKSIGYITEGSKRIWYKINCNAEIRKYTQKDQYKVIEKLCEKELKHMVLSFRLDIYIYLIGAFISSSGGFFTIGSEYGQRADIATILGIKEGSTIYNWLLMQQIKKDKSDGNTFICETGKSKIPIPLFLLYVVFGSEGIADFIDSRVNISMDEDTLKMLFADVLYQSAESLYNGI